MSCYTSCHITIRLDHLISFLGGGDVGLVWVTCFIEGPVNIFLQLLLKLFSHKKEDVREI